MADLLKGTFMARAVTGQWGEIESKEKGTMGFGILFEIVEGEHKGWRGRWESWFAAGEHEVKSRERIFDSLSYCGWDGKSLKNAVGLDTNIVPIEIDIEESPPVDKKDAAGVVIGKEPGKKYSRIKWVNDPARGGTIHKIPDAAAQDAFEDRMQGALEAWRAKRNKPVQDTGTSFDFGANAPPEGQQQSAPQQEAPRDPPPPAAQGPNPNTGY